MKLAVSLAALAVVLMTSSALAKDPKTDSSTTNAKPTAANAAAFIARAEKELFDYSVDASRVAWVNATYITDDTDALTAQSGAKGRSEEHTSELQSLMRISYAVFCLKQKNKIYKK